MPRIAIVGAGQAGTQLALGLLERGYDVTLVSDRSPAEIRVGSVMSSQCMFETALQTERDLGLNLWEQDCPTVEQISFTLHGDEGGRYQWASKLDGYAQSVDQRVKVAGWIELFADRGGKVVLKSATVADLEDLARTHDLVVVSTGKGELGRLFPRDPERSPYDQPQRVLALTYVTGMAPREAGPAVSFNVAPGVGEYFVFPALTTTGPCEIMVFEGVPGGPMDCWDDVRTPEAHLARSLEILTKHFPDEADRCRDVALTDDGGVLRGRLTPTVRRPVASLPSGAQVLGLADAVVLNDPLTGQGSNNAAKAASFYLDSITGQGADEFTAEWMTRTFENYWRGWAQWVVAWTNSLLAPPHEHVSTLLAAAAEVPGIAATVANGFDDPRVFFPWWFDATSAERFVAEKRAQESTSFDPREMRQALGQYATGVTVVTCRGQDGHRIGDDRELVHVCLPRSPVGAVVPRRRTLPASTTSPPPATSRSTSSRRTSTTSPGSSRRRRRTSSPEPTSRTGSPGSQCWRAPWPASSAEPSRPTTPEITSSCSARSNGTTRQAASLWSSTRGSTTSPPSTPTSETTTRTEAQMILPPLRYLRPASASDAVHWLASIDGAVVLAGGQTLVNALKLDLVAPTALVDIHRLEELRSIDVVSRPDTDHRCRDDVRGARGVTRCAPHLPSPSRPWQPAWSTVRYATAEPSGETSASTIRPTTSRRSWWHSVPASTCSAPKEPGPSTPTTSSSGR